MSYAMFGVPNQVYDVGRKYLADTDGKIADVADINDRKALRDAGVLDEDPIVSVTATDAIGSSVGASGVIQMADGSSGFLASQITDTGTVVKIANGQIETPPATPIILISDTGVALGAYPTLGQDTINAGAVYANSVLLTASPMALIQTQTPAAASSVNFTGLTTYDHYLLIGSRIVLSAAANLLLVIGTGGTPTWDTTAGDYSWSTLYSLDSSPAVGAQVATQAVLALGGIPVAWLNTTGGSSAGFEVRIVGALSTAGNVMAQSFGFFNGVGDNVQEITSGAYSSGVATGFRLIPASGTVSGKFSLYGIAT